MNNEIRNLRKGEHIENFMNCAAEKDNYFKDIYIENNSLPELNFNEIDTRIRFAGKEISFPLMLNAITGGYEGAVDINRNLALLAKKFNIPIAVGSQTVALRDKAQEYSFRVVRETAGDGIVISNLSARSSYEDVLAAVEMIKADAIQLHLNAAQEICMEEGERDFKGILKNIENIIRRVKVPVIIKEVGFGISKSTARKLFGVGVKHIDIGGRGGTNFILIESSRNRKMDFSDLAEWGIPTALSLIQCCSISSEVNVICSGGISTAEEIIKALCIGAGMTAVSGAVLRELLDKGYSSSEEMLEHIIYKSRALMLLLGKQNISGLREVPYILKGELRELHNSMKQLP